MKLDRMPIVGDSGELIEPSQTAPIRGPLADAVVDWDALAQPQPEYVFSQEVQW